MQYTIEARELISESTHRLGINTEPARTTVEAAGPREAVTQFVRSNRSELVSLTRPQPGRESIATVKKGEAVYLVRIYEN